MKKQSAIYTPSRLSILLLFLGLHVFSCQTPIEQTPIPITAKIQETSVPVPITPVTTQASSTHLILTQEPIQIPTMVLADARKRVQQLLETNNNCQLPCWWGITPGKTLWQDALEILAPVSTLYFDTDMKMNLSTIAVRVQAPTDEHGNVLFQNYVVKNDVVKRIDVYNFDFAPFLYFKQFVHEYGVPSQIYIRGYRDVGFELALFYPEKGIFATYSRTSKSDGKNLKSCFDSAKSPFLYLWSPDQPMSFDEAMSTFRVQIEDIPTYRPIEEAIDNYDEFIRSLLELGSPSCVESPVDLWPRQN